MLYFFVLISYLFYFYKFNYEKFVYFFYISLKFWYLLMFIIVNNLVKIIFDWKNYL